jgi:hypothetical protein
VRLFRNGADWTQRSPKIAEAALKIRATHFAIDGERVMRGVDGISDFSDALEDPRKCSLTLLMRTPSAATTCALGRDTSLANLAQLTRAQGDFHCVALSPQDRKIETSGTTCFERPATAGWNRPIRVGAASALVSKDRYHDTTAT